MYGLRVHRRRPDGKRLAIIRISDNRPIILNDPRWQSLPTHQFVPTLLIGVFVMSEIFILQFLCGILCGVYAKGICCRNADSV